MKLLCRIMSIVVLALLLFTGCVNDQAPDKSVACQHSVQIGYCPICGEYITTLSPQFSKIKDSFKKALDELDLAERDFADYKNSDLKNDKSFVSGKQHLKNVRNALTTARKECGDYEDFKDLKNDFAISINLFGGEKRLSDYVATMTACLASMDFPAKRLDALDLKKDGQSVTTDAPLYDEEESMCISSNELKVNADKTLYVDICLFDTMFLWGPQRGGAPFSGDHWKGQCRVEIYNDSDRNSLLFSKKISVEEDNDYLEFYKDGLTAESRFSLCFDDYNNDGNFEFVLGQYLRSNAKNGYAMYSINSETGEVTRIDTDGIILNDSTEYSILLKKNTSTSFISEITNISTKEKETTVYQWKRNMFVKKD